MTGGRLQSARRAVLRHIAGPLRRHLGVTVAGVILAMLFAVVFAVRLPEPFGPDQGLFACFSRWVPRGWLPYRDLFDSKPPLFLYWFVLARLVPDDFPRALWWLEGVWLSATLVFIAVFVSRLWGRAAGIGSAGLLLVGLWAPGFGGFWSRAQAEEVLALPMLGSAWLALRAHDREELAFPAGLLAGVCSLMKVPSLAIAGAWSLFFLVRLGGVAAWRRVGKLLAGVAIAWLAAFGWFAAHGEAARFAGSVFFHQLAYAKLLARPWVDVLSELPRTLVSAAALPFATAMLGCVALFRRRAPEAVWLAGWMGVSIAAVAAQRQLAEYHYLLAMPALAVGGGYGISILVVALHRGERARRAGLAALSIVVLLSVRAAGSWWAAYAPGAAYLAGRMSRSAYLRQIQLWTYSTATEEEVARIVRENTRPEQGILVWAWYPGIYALSDRHPATRYAFHKVMLTDAPLSMATPGLDERRAELMGRFAVDPPAYVIVANGDRNFFDPKHSHVTWAEFRELRDRVDREYVLERRVGRLTLYRRKS